MPNPMIATRGTASKIRRRLPMVIALLSTPSFAVSAARSPAGRIRVEPDTLRQRLARTGVPLCRDVPQDPKSADRPVQATKPFFQALSSDGRPRDTSKHSGRKSHQTVLQSPRKPPPNSEPRRLPIAGRSERDLYVQRRRQKKNARG